MTYEVTITAMDGKQTTFPCGGTTDQEALIYAGKIVEEHADSTEPNASVDVTKDGKKIGPLATVADMTTRAV